jgi:hypothetical protein
MVVFAGLAAAAGVICLPTAWAQTVPPPINVPQVTPRFNDPGPQVTIPPPGNPQQQLYPYGSQGYSPHNTRSRVKFTARHDHHTAKHRSASRAR